MSDERLQLRAAALTISDSCSAGTREDRSGPALAEALRRWGADVVVEEILPDDREQIAARLRELADALEIDLVATTGGTGFAPRDVTPEATRDVVEREAPGLAELMRLRGLEKTPLAHLSRGICGVRGATVLVNLPGSPKGAVESFEAVRAQLAHAVETLTGRKTNCSG
jgi:molybdenum cofactor synthesis domain-containing protein